MKNTNVIDNLNELKKMPVKNLVHELRVKMDPDVAACCAWYIQHSGSPSSWQRWLTMCYNKMTKMSVDQIPRKGFSDRIWKIIDEHYRECHLFGRKVKLL